MSRYAPPPRRAVVPDDPPPPGWDAVLGPVRHGNAYEETVERLLAVVRLGVVGCGRRLPPERELAATLGVSRMTLREAIRALAEAGYLRSARGRAAGGS